MQKEEKEELSGREGCGGSSSRPSSRPLSHKRNNKTAYQTYASKEVKSDLRDSSLSKGEASSRDSQTTPLHAPTLTKTGTLYLKDSSPLHSKQKPNINMPLNHDMIDVQDNDYYEIMTPSELMQPSSKGLSSPVSKKTKKLQKSNNSKISELDENNTVYEKSETSRQ